MTGDSSALLLMAELARSALEMRAEPLIRANGGRGRLHRAAERASAGTGGASAAGRRQSGDASGGACVRAAHEPRNSQPPARLGPALFKQRPADQISISILRLAAAAWRGAAVCTCRAATSTIALSLAQAQAASTSEAGRKRGHQGSPALRSALLARRAHRSQPRQPISAPCSLSHRRPRHSRHPP
jgi:hypothetical protein